MKGTSVGILLLAFGAAGASTPVLADDLLGLYVGAAFGKSTVRTEKNIIGDTNYSSKFDAGHSAWKVTAGFRPISPLGVEFEYIDFGNPTAGTNSALGGLRQVDEKALALFGVGYLPLPAPFLTLYGKFGISRLRMTTTEVPPTPFGGAGGAACGGVTGKPCSPISPNISELKISDWTTHFVYGAGVQGKIGAVAIRGEYERIGASGDSPDLISVGLTWNF